MKTFTKMFRSIETISYYFQTIFTKQKKKNWICIWANRNSNSPIQTDQLYTSFNIHSRSKIRPDSSQPDIGLISQDAPEVDSKWNASEIFQVVLISIAGLVFLFLLALTLIRVLLPDSFARMRVSLYGTFVGKRPDSEELFFLM